MINISYIERALKGVQNRRIVKFLEREGFKHGTGAQGEGSMYYVASGDLYCVWFALCDDHISLYAEYDCGGCVGKEKCYFIEDDFPGFLAAYYSAVDWAKNFI